MRVGGRERSRDGWAAVFAAGGKHCWPLVEIRRARRRSTNDGTRRGGRPRASVGRILPIEILNTEYLSGLAGLSVASGELLVAFIAPPWGDALGKTSGLDLRRTTPPIPEIVDCLLHRFPENPLLCAVQIYEMVLPASMAELKARFDYSTLRVYDLNAPGQNHGILLGTKGWAP